MPEKVLVSLATGLEDPERVTVAFLVAGPRSSVGSKLRSGARRRRCAWRCPERRGVACDGCPPLGRLFEQFAQGDGELLICPICVKARQIDEGRFRGDRGRAGAPPILGGR